MQGPGSFSAWLINPSRASPPLYLTTASGSPLGLGEACELHSGHGERALGAPKTSPGGQGLASLLLVPNPNPKTWAGYWSGLAQWEIIDNYKPEVGGEGDAKKRCPLINGQKRVSQKLRMCWGLRACARASGNVCPCGPPTIHTLLTLRVRWERISQDLRLRDLSAARPGMARGPGSR